MRGFHTFEAYISQHGGILSRAELLDAGWTADEVRLGSQYGTLTRLCRGWYGSRDLPDLVRSAWAHGGPLACVTALEFLTVIAPHGQTPELHVCRPTRGHRLRPAGNAAIHWSDDAYASGTRWCVSREFALRQAARCAPHRLPPEERERLTPAPWPGADI